MTTRARNVQHSEENYTASGTGSMCRAPCRNSASLVPAYRRRQFKRTGQRQGTARRSYLPQAPHVPSLAPQHSPSQLPAAPQVPSPLHSEHVCTFCMVNVPWSLFSAE
jgi:hypothetical protein